MTTALDIQAREQQLNDLIRSGKALEAFERYYADDCVMEESLSETYEGKATNLQREQEFFGSVKEVHALELLNGAVGGDVTYSEWKFDLTFKNGDRANFVQVARRRWRDGKIVHERFYKAA